MPPMETDRHGISLEAGRAICQDSSMKTRRLGGIVVFSVLCSCGSQSDASAGISTREMRVLQESWGWLPEYTPPKYSVAELETLMDRSSDPTLDGEYAEGQCAALSVALASEGDDCFAKVLMTRNSDVQAAVIRRVDYLWNHYKLRYPHTQAIAKICQCNTKPNPG